MFERVRQIPGAIWLISLSSLLLTAAAGMSFSVFGLFLEHLGVTVASIGAIDGVLEGFGCCLKMLSGVMSDYLRRRKLIFALGPLCSMVAKGMVVLTLSAKGLIYGRLIDRMGNGLQASPRDALVGDYAPPKIRGVCFGLRQGLGSLGSVLGSALITVLFHKHLIDFKNVFQLAFIAGFASFCLITFFVKDCPNPQRESAVKEKRSPFRWQDIPKLSKSFWVLLGIVGVFTLCRMSESLIILFAKRKFSLQTDSATQVLFYYNLTAVLTALFSGKLVDRYSPVSLLMAGTLTTFLANLVMGITGTYAMFRLGIFLWGVQIGLMQNIFCTEITRLVPLEFRGTGFGLYYLVTAVDVIIASSVCGSLVGSLHGEWAFIYGLAISTLSFLVVWLTRRTLDR